MLLDRYGSIARQYYLIFNTEFCFFAHEYKLIYLYKLFLAINRMRCVLLGEILC